jgi:hypothetical protein
VARKRVGPDHPVTSFPPFCASGVDVVHDGKVLRRNKNANALLLLLFSLFSHTLFLPLLYSLLSPALSLVWLSEHMKNTMTTKKKNKRAVEGLSSWKGDKSKGDEARHWCTFAEANSRDMRI